MNFYKIHGAANKGQSSMKTFARKLLESDDKRDMGFKIYEQIYEEVFEGDNYMYNPDIVSEYF